MDEKTQRYKVVPYEVESDSGTGRTWWHTRNVKDSEGDYILYSDYAKSDYAKLEDELVTLREEASENARIIGMSGSREAQLLTEIERLTKLVAYLNSEYADCSEVVQNYELASVGEKWIEIKEGCEMPELTLNRHAASEDVLVGIIRDGRLLNWDRACLCTDNKRWARNGIHLHWTPTHYMYVAHPPYQERRCR